MFALATLKLFISNHLCVANGSKLLEFAGSLLVLLFCLYWDSKIVVVGNRKGFDASLISKLDSEGDIYVMGGIMIGCRIGVSRLMGVFFRRILSSISECFSYDEMEEQLLENLLNFFVSNLNFLIILKFVG